MTLTLDFRHALRRLRARPVESAVQLATLTLALGANTAVFTVLHAVLLAPLPYHQPDRLMAITETQSKAGLRGQPVAYANLRDWQTATRSFDRIAGARPTAFTIGDTEHAERIPALRVTPDLLATLGLTPTIGRDFERREGEAGRDGVALLSHDLWVRRFAGDPHAVGRTLHLDGRPVEIIGVLPPGIRYPGLRIPSRWLRHLGSVRRHARRGAALLSLDAGRGSPA